MTRRAQGERIYPTGALACAVVWLLDRLPLRVLHAVLSSYWSPADVEAVRRQSEKWEELFDDT